MKRALSLVRLACLVAGLLILKPSAHAQFQLNPLRSFNISSVFDGSAGGCGDGAIDVAFDGTNAYVAGFRSGSGSGSAGIVRINDVLNLPSGTLAYGTGTRIYITLAAGVGATLTSFTMVLSLRWLRVGACPNPNTQIVRMNTIGMVDEFWSGEACCRWLI